MSREQKKRSIDMLNGPLTGKIVAFAIPLALSSALQQLLSSCDASIAGHFVSSQSLAGIGATVPITSTFVNFFVGISIGSNVAMAIRIGRHEEDRVSDVLHTSIALALVLGIGLMALGLALSEWLVDVVGMPQDARADALVYLKIYFIALPFLTIYNFGSALMRARGDSRRPLYALAVAVAINFALDLAFTTVIPWETTGIALATVISFAASAAIIVRWLMRDEGPYRLYLRKLRFVRISLRLILHIGIPAGLQGAIFSLSNTIIQAAIDGFGSAAMAGSAATMNLEYYTYFFVNAFGQTAVTFVGQNYAAGQHGRCIKIARWCLLFGATSALAVSLIFVGLGTTALGIFTTDPAALEYGLIRLWIVELLEIFTSLYEVPAGVMRGMGVSTLPAVITIIGSVVLRIIYVFAIFPHFGTFPALLAIYPVTWWIMDIAMLVAYFVIRRRKLLPKASQTTERMSA
ncbi:MAG: MATE family efflux transporter [Coriobacteriales bacterium]|jgi:putative MATE family efflux protein